MRLGTLILTVFSMSIWYHVLSIHLSYVHVMFLTGLFSCCPIIITPSQRCHSNSHGRPSITASIPWCQKTCPRRIITPSPSQGLSSQQSHKVKNLNKNNKDKCPIFGKKFLALAVALVRSAIPYSQLSSSDWTLGPTSRSSSLTHSSLESQSLYLFLVDTRVYAILHALLHWVLSYTTIPFSKKWHPNILSPFCSFLSLSLFLPKINHLSPSQDPVASNPLFETLCKISPSQGLTPPNKCTTT